MNKSAIISPCGTYRYSLTREWSSQDRITFIMLNPSTADAENDDPTIRRLLGFAKLWGYGSIQVFNLFAYRSSSPARMFDAQSMGVDIIGPENDSLLKNSVGLSEKVVFAWGVNGGFLNRNKAVCALFPQAYCLGISKQGHPKHPLYIKSDAPLIIYGGS